MLSVTPITDIAHIIQLAVAPVFLLAGIGAMLNVLTARLARIIDRARALEQMLPQQDARDRDWSMRMLDTLDRRMRVIHIAITLCTASALFVCIVVSLLFVADLGDFGLGRTIALLFIAAMLLIVGGLVMFLVEIRLATRSVRVRRDLMRLP